jgi:hypothetical protein
MKNTLIIIGLAMSISAAAQIKASPTDYKTWDYTCYCSTNLFTPHQVVNADNNWQILYALRGGHTLKTLDSLGIPYTQSQKLLLLAYNLLEQNGKNYAPAFPILDSLQTAELRQYSLKAATAIYDSIKASSKELNAYLVNNKMGGNAYSILFSYVFDGLVWKKFEDAKLTSKREYSDTWNGVFWALRPERKNEAGTNSFINGNISISTNWNEETFTDKLLGAFYADKKIIDAFLKEYGKRRKIADSAIINYLKPFGFFDDNNNIAIPVIDETVNNELCVLSDNIAEKIAGLFAEKADLPEIQAKYNLKDANETAVILYHEVMWDFLDLLVKNKIIRKPPIFENPATATKADIATLNFLLIRKNVEP